MNNATMLEERKRSVLIELGANTVARFDVSEVYIQPHYHVSSPCLVLSNQQTMPDRRDPRYNLALKSISRVRKFVLIFSSGALNVISTELKAFTPKSARCTTRMLIITRIGARSAFTNHLLFPVMGVIVAT